MITHNSTLHSYIIYSDSLDTRTMRCSPPHLILCRAPFSRNRFTGAITHVQIRHTCEVRSGGTDRSTHNDEKTKRGEDVREQIKCRRNSIIRAGKQNCPVNNLCGGRVAAYSLDRTWRRRSLSTHLCQIFEKLEARQVWHLRSRHFYYPVSIGIR